MDDQTSNFRLKFFKLIIEKSSVRIPLFEQVRQKKSQDFFFSNMFMVYLFIMNIDTFYHVTGVFHERRYFCIIFAID